MKQDKNLAIADIVDLVMPVTEYSPEQRQEIITTYMQMLEKQHTQFNSKFYCRERR